MQELTQTRDVSAPTFDAPVAYWSLIFLTFIMYIAPMGYFPILIPLRLAFVSALLAIGTYILAIFSEGRRLSVWGAEVKLVVWLVVFAILSIPFSRWSGGSYEVLFDTYLKSVIVFLLIANLMTSERRLRGFLWALTFYCAFNAVVGINEYRNGSFIKGRIAGAGFSGLTANPNDLALSLNLLIPFMWYLAVSSRRHIQKSFAMGSLVLSVIAVVLTFSRGGAITLFSILAFMVWTGSRRNRLPALVMAAFTIIIVLALGPQGYSDRLASTTDFSKDDGSASARWQLMIIGLRQTIEHPLGVGLGMNNLVQFDQGLGWTMVHNVYLEISTELGILPAVLFIVLLWKLVIAMKAIQVSNGVEMSTYSVLARATQASLIAFAVGAMFHPVAYNFYFYIIAGIALALKEIVGALERTPSSISEDESYAKSAKETWKWSYSGGQDGISW